MAQKSRPARWADASGAAKSALEAMAGHLDDLENALEELHDVQEEYEENKDNMPENLANSSYGEKLEAVCNLEIEGIADAVKSAIDEAIDKVGEADEIDLPRGFGKD